MFDIHIGISIEIVLASSAPDAVAVVSGCRVTLDCKAMVWEGAYTLAKPLAQTSASAPLEFTVSACQVAEGLDLAVQRLKCGDTAVVTCVPNFAYGEDGLEPHVPPRAHIIYEVTVRSVEAASGSAPEAPVGPALLLVKASACSKAAALEDQFYRLQNRSSTRMQVKLSPGETRSTEDLIQQAAKMGIN
jgi:hypothetical protein